MPPKSPEKAPRSLKNPEGELSCSPKATGFWGFSRIWACPGSLTTGHHESPMPVALGKAHSRGSRTPPHPNPAGGSSGADPHGTGRCSSSGHWTCTGERAWQGRGRGGTEQGRGQAGVRQGGNGEGKGAAGMSKGWGRSGAGEGQPSKCP